MAEFEIRDGETDAEARLRWHEDPEIPFFLGSVSLAEIKLAIDNGEDEATAKDYTTEELLALHDDPDHPLELENPDLLR